MTIQQSYCIQDCSFEPQGNVLVLKPSKCFYLLIIFGSGVLFLSVQSSQSRLSPCIRAGTAQWFVCCALPTGVVSGGNTDQIRSVHCAALFRALIYLFEEMQQYDTGEERGEKKAEQQSLILTLTVCHAETQRRSHVSVIAQHHSMRTTVSKKNVLLSRFICLIRPNKGSVVKCFSFLRQQWRKAKLPSELWQRVFRGLKSQREKQCMQKWDIIHPITALTGFAQVKPPRWAWLIFQNRRLPHKCLQREDDIMTLEAKCLLSCAASGRLTSDSRLIAHCPGRFLFWQGHPAWGQITHILITCWICCHLRSVFFFFSLFLYLTQIWVLIPSEMGL